MAVSFDTSSGVAAPAVASSTVAWTHTVGVGTFRVLYVGIVRLANHTVNSVVSNLSGPLTPLKDNKTETSAGVSVWVLLNPASGTHTITATLASADNAGGISLSFFGARQAVTQDSVAINGGSSTAPSATTNTVANNAFVFDMMGANQNGGAPATCTPFTLEQSIVGRVLVSCSMTGPVTPPGTETNTYTLGGSVPWNDTIISVAPQSSSDCPLTISSDETFLMFANPTLEVGGALFQAFFHTADDTLTMKKSMDGGETWANVGTPLAITGAGEGLYAVTDGTKIYCLSFSSSAFVQMSTFDPVADTWVNVISTNGPTVSGNTSTPLAAFYRSDGNIVVGFADIAGGGLYQAYYFLFNIAGTYTAAVECGNVGVTADDWEVVAIVQGVGPEVELIFWSGPLVGSSSTTLTVWRQPLTGTILGVLQNIYVDSIPADPGSLPEFPAVLAASDGVTIMIVTAFDITATLVRAFVAKTANYIFTEHDVSSSGSAVIAGIPYVGGFGTLLVVVGNDGTINTYLNQFITPTPICTTVLMQAFSTAFGLLGSALAGFTWITDRHFPQQPTDGNTFLVTFALPTPLPIIVTPPMNQTVTVGSTATFSVVATGSGLTYQWYKNGTLIVGATATSYTTPPTTSADNGSSFSVIVCNASGCVTAGPATLTVITPSTSLASAGGGGRIFYPVFCLVPPPGKPKYKGCGVKPACYAIPEREWVDQTPGCIPFNPAGAIPLPAPGAGDTVILSFRVPIGYDGMILGQYNALTANFTQGSGDIIWRISAAGRYLRDRGNIKVTIGSPKRVYPVVGGLQLRSGNLVEFIVNAPNTGGSLPFPGAANVLAGLHGWFYPRK